MKTYTLRFRALPVFFLLTGLATLTALSLVVKSHAARGVKALPAVTEEAARTRNVASSATMPAALAAPLPPLALNVDTTLDVAALSACTAAAADCSLRGAIITANANPGSTINVPAGTYLLTVPGAGEQLAATGDLDVRATGTSIVGAGAASTIIQQTIVDRVFETNPVPQAVGFTFSISGVTIQNGSTTAAGGGILGGGPGAVTTITDCVFDNNRTTGTLASNGGAISFTSANTGDLNVSGTSFTNNITATGVGGAIRFSSTGTLTVTTSNFVGNRATTNSGGALNVTGPGAGGSYNVSQSNFFNNQALGAASRGGAALVANGLLNISYSRLVSNISGSGIGTAVSGPGTTGLTANNNWWGQNSGPSAGDVFGTTALVSWLQLRHVANPNSICANASTTLTADIFGLNTGGSTAPSNLTGLPAFPALFSNPMNGTISGASTSFVNGVATATFTAGPSNGSGSADAKADNQTVTASINIESNTTSAIGNQAVCAGATATFSTTASGSGPFSFVWKKGATVLNNGDLGGRVTITSGASSSSLSISNVQTGDSDTYTVEATGACSTATQSGTLTVNAATTATTPADQTVCQGATANFSTTAGGTGPFSYAWSVDGSSFGGNTSSISVPTGALSTGNHPVSVTVTGACGSDTQNATLTVQESTSTTDPADQTVCQGASANFSTTASGTGPFSYAWTVDGSPAGSNSSSLSVNTSSLSVGNHTVSVTTTGGCGSASQSATLTVQENTSTTDPADQTVCQGASANFSTTASGTGPFTYAWTVDAAPFGGNTSSISVATGSLSVGNHTVSVTTTGGCGSASQSATLTVNENTSASDPADQTVCQGATAGFSTTASGTAISYAWTVDAVPFGGNTSSISVPTGSLSIGNHTIGLSVSGTCGTVTQSATLTVNENTSASDPADQTVCQGATAGFSTTASGTAISYAWTVDAVSFGGNTSSISVPTGLLSIGNHTIGLSVSGTCGTVTQSAALTVQENTSTTDPADQTVCQGATANFSTTASGTGPFTYAWTVDAVPFGGNTSSISVPTGVLTLGNHTVSVTTTGACGSASQSATLTVQENTSTTDPPDQTVCQGTTATFSTTASGTGPFSYAWTLDGSPTGGNSSSVSIATGSLSPGNHTVSVTTTGTCGSASQSATLTVNSAPIVTLNPVSQSATSGSVTFTAAASGSPAPTVQWQVSTNGGFSFSDIPGATSTSLTVAVSPSVNGNQYRAVFTNSCGTATTTAATLTTCSPPVITVGNSQLSMWPPNHKYETFNISSFNITATSNCNGNITSSVVITSVTSDELDENPSGGDGNTTNDIVIAADCKSVQLRAERDGNLDGRVYTIAFKVTDSFGNTTTATARVIVPHDQGNGGAVDSGPHSVVNSTCP
jgi:Immunoglobulin I-set domain